MIFRTFLVPRFYLGHRIFAKFFSLVSCQNWWASSELFRKRVTQDTNRVRHVDWLSLLKFDWLLLRLGVFQRVLGWKCIFALNSHIFNVTGTAQWNHGKRAWLYWKLRKLLLRLSHGSVLQVLISFRDPIDVSFVFLLLLSVIVEFFFLSSLQTLLLISQFLDFEDGRLT